MINIPRRTTLYVAVGCLFVLAIGAFVASRYPQGPHPSFPYGKTLTLQTPEDPNCRSAILAFYENGRVARRDCCNTFQYEGHIAGDYVVITGSTGLGTMMACKTESRTGLSLPSFSQKVRWWREGDFIMMQDQFSVSRFKIEER